ncbi:MAG: hypothetical protein ACWGMZ_00830 [Thermoguttaceae bacterium]
MTKQLTFYDLQNYFFTTQERLLTWLASGAFPPPIFVSGQCRWAEEVVRKWDETHFRSQKLQFSEIEKIAQAVHAEDLLYDPYKDAEEVEAFNFKTLRREKIKKPKPRSTFFPQ